MISAIGEAAVVRINAAVLRRLRPRLAAGRVAEAWRPGGGRAVVVAPHPDDETLGAGGTIALHLEAGDPVRVVVVTDGRASRADGLGPAAMARRRAGELHRAASVLGIADLVHLRVPEGEWERHLVAAELEPLVADARMIYAPSPVDFHPDHLGVARALADVAPRTARVRIMELGVPLGPALVDRIADVGRVADRKSAALAAHASQAGALRPLERLVRYRAALHGPATSETFWEVTAAAYVRLVAAAAWNGRPPPFRGLRPRPHGDLAAYLKGHRWRLRLREEARGPAPRSGA